MKKVLYIITFSILAFGLLNATENLDKLTNRLNTEPTLSSDLEHLKKVSLENPAKKRNTLQAEDGVIYNILNQYMGANKHSPVSYEPTSGFFYFTVLDITLEGVLEADNQGGIYGNIAHLFYLDPNTGEWGHDTTRVDYDKFEYYNYPSLYVTNPLASNDREDHVVYTHFTFWAIDTENPGFITPAGSRVFISALAYDYGYDYRDMDPFPFIGPDKNEADENNYIWNDVDLIGLSGNDETSFYFVSPLLPADRNADRYGAYGIQGYDVVFGDKITDKVPENWGYDDFRFDAGNGGSFGNAANLGADDAGNLYMAINHLFNSQIEDRAPGVSKSTDQGVTWSEFNIMSADVLRDYAADNGFPDINVGSNISYDIDGFKVLAEDVYSYVYRVNLFNAEGTLANVHVVEAMYDESGTWSLNFIADLNSSQITSLSTAPLIPVYLGKNLRLGTNSRGHELELAITADGKYEVAKWIDINLEHMAVMPEGWNDLIESVNGVWQIVEDFDTLFACDIYMSWKEVGTDTWNGPFNVTNDEENSFNTFMPDIIPNLTNIPLMMLRTVDYEGLVDGRGMFNTTPDLLEQYVVEKIYKDVVYMELDATADVIAEPTKILEHDNAENFIGFGYVGTDGDVTEEITFTNSGNTALTITDFNAIGDTEGFSFSVATTPLVIEPKSSGVLEVTFAPSVVGKEYEATLTLASDADNNEDISITLFGMGVYKSVYQENSEFIDIAINPNPISQEGSIDFTINGIKPQSVKMSLFSSTGKNIAVLFDQIVLSGTSKSIELNADKFTSGSYNLIIEIDGKLLRRSIIINK